MGSDTRTAQSIPSDPSSPEAHSLYHHAREEALRHKWIESEKAGHDLGDEPITEWNRRYWWRWCRARWLEHIQGEVFWREYEAECYGLLDRRTTKNPMLEDRVIDRIKAGYENLDIILWATRWGLDIREIHDILSVLDMNKCRFAPM